MIAMAACVAAVGVGPQAASAKVLEKTVVTCQTTATWQVTRGLTARADVTLDASAPTGCRNLNAEIEDDLNFLFRSYNDAYPGFASTYDLIGVFATGMPQFVGVASAGGRVFGPVEILNATSLNATLSGLTPSGGNIVQEHLPAGGCGPDCYRTNVALTGIWDF
ncbi:MAG TPA: hypothetical protein VHF45_09205 [Thermoleophilaceae bacterium]|nr:hypothetical protein [Thermoleophilaceae bacterium]